MVLRTAWRAPVDAYKWLRTWTFVLALGRKGALWEGAFADSWPSHERLQAALLRAARDEAAAYLSRLGPRPARRRRRRLAALERKRAAAKAGKGKTKTSRSSSPEAGSARDEV